MCVVLGGMSAAGGVAGLLVGAAFTSNNSNPGPLDFFPLEDDAARTTIAELRLAQCWCGPEAAQPMAMNRPSGPGTGLISLLPVGIPLYSRPSHTETWL